MCEKTSLRWSLALALLWAFQSSLASVQAQGITPDPAEMRKALDDLTQNTRSSFEAAQKSIDALKEEVHRLRREVDDLRRERGTPPQETRYGAAAAASGTIRLVNAYVQSMTVIVNGTRYTLAPGERRTLRRITPGGFTYEIPGVKEAVDRTLDANETFTIRIHER